jgi:hypothetical protein
MQLARFSRLLLVLIGCVPGCVAMPGDRPVTVLVRDAETKKPLAAADVLIQYPLRATFGPSNSRGDTDNNGVVRLHATPTEDGVTLLDVLHPGYLSESKELSPKAIAVIERPGWFERAHKRTPDFIVDLYAEPRPRLELIAPVGFQGVIKVHIETNDAPCPPGQRDFSATVASNEAIFTGPPLLRHATVADYTARFAEGAAVPRNAKEPDVGLWWYKEEAGDNLFFIGTESQFRVLNAGDHRPAGNGKSQGSGGGGGKGRRGRGGAGS